MLIGIATTLTRGGARGGGVAGAAMLGGSVLEVGGVQARARLRSAVIAAAMLCVFGRGLGIVLERDVMLLTGRRRGRSLQVGAWPRRRLGER